MVPVLVDSWYNIVAAGSKSVELKDDQVEIGELKRLLTGLGDADQEVAIL